MELFKGEYALNIIMLAKKYVFTNWNKGWMCGDYKLPINKPTRFDKYAMPFSKKILCSIGQAYRNPNLGFTTKARACEGAGQE